MKALAISGGSTKIGFLAGSAIELCKRNNYDIITGISAGSIISLLLAIDEFDLLEKSILPIDTPNFFKKEPLNDNNNVTLSAIWRIITGKVSLAEFTLKELIELIYSKDHHNRLQKSGKVVKVGAVNLNLKQIEYFDISKVDYETAIKWVVASSSIPVTTEPVKIGKYLYTDGGVFEHVGGLEAIQSGATELDVIFSRPEKKELSPDDISWDPKNVIDVLFKILSVMSDNNSWNDEKLIRKSCQINDVRLTIYFAPFKLTTGMYKMDPDLTKSWFELGREQVLNKYLDQ